MYKKELFPYLRHTFNITDSDLGIAAAGSSQNSSASEMDIEMCRVILDEITTAQFEQRPEISKYNISGNMRELINEFWLDYYYNYAFGSNVVTKIANTELFNFILTTFDGKANTTINNITPYNFHL